MKQIAILIATAIAGIVALWAVLSSYFPGLWESDTTTIAVVLGGAAVVVLLILLDKAFSPYDDR